MKTKLLVLVFCLFCGISVFAQSDDSLNNEIREKAKEHIISQSSEEFFDNLTEFEIGRYKNVNPLLMMDDIVKNYYTDIIYYIITDYRKSFCFRKSNKHSTSTSSSIEIFFDEKMNVIYSTDINDVYKGFRLYQELSTISNKEIKELSKKLSNNKNMKVRFIRYIYELGSDSIYLEIEREKGFKNVLVETQQIDINTQSLIKSEIIPFYRTLPEAFSEWFLRLFD